MRKSIGSLLLATGLIAGLAHSYSLAATVPIAFITAVGAGEAAYGLALRQDGAVLAWGDNASGTLGNGTTDPSLLPALVSGLGPGSGVIALAPSAPFALALKADGTVLSWGSNVLGALGDGTFTTRLTPVVVSGLGAESGVIGVAVGLSHSVALKSDGSVWTWGSNNNSNLGNPDVVGPSNVPVPVSGLGSGSGVVAIAGGGNFTLALKSDGTIWAWGNNNNGQLGIGNTTNQPVPVQVKGPGGVGALTGITAVSAPPAAGGAFAVALRDDGSVWAWGNNSTGQLGDGTTIGRTTPVQVKGMGGVGVLGDVATIDAGGGTSNLHVLAMTTDGTVLAWGSNANGQLGTGNNTSSLVPVPVSGLSPGSSVAAVSAAAGFSFAVLSNGALLAWGDNGSGQLGDGTFFGRTTPAPIASGAGPAIRTISTQIGANHSLATRDDGTVLAWGSNGAGQLGTGDRVNRAAPVVVPSLVNVTATATGASHSLALKVDGSVWAWGDNSTGQLGIGNTLSQLAPVQVKTSAATTLNGAVAIATATNSSFALTGDGQVWSWGINAVGQLGINSTATQVFAVPVHGVGDVGLLTGATAISTNGGAAFALLNDGTVVGWGQNAAGQVGDGTTIQRLTPVQTKLGPGSGVVAIGAIAGGGLALKGDGTVLAWGLNGSGQVGDGTSMQRSAPVQAAGLGPGSGVVGIAGGGGVGPGHTLGVRIDGTVRSWGTNGSGQLGNGTLNASFVPGSVAGATDIRSVAGGAAHSLALTAAGTVLSWGANGSGQLGDGTVYTRNRTPAFVLFDDLTAPVVSISASDTRLWPPNNKLRTIVIKGTAGDADSGVVQATYAVVDEYGLIQPAGAVSLGAGGAFSFSLHLPATRFEEDHDGRNYLVVVGAQDVAGNGGSASVQITVPHDTR